MKITEMLTGKPVEVLVMEIEDVDFKRLSKKRYFFDWSQYKRGYLVYKLIKTDSDEILGVMAITDVPFEYRMEISLICCSRENCTANKQYDRIAGCLIAFASVKASEKHGRMAAVSLLPKTELRNHYKIKYGMEEGGKQLFLFDASLKNLIKEYL